MDIFRLSTPFHCLAARTSFVAVTLAILNTVLRAIYSDYKPISDQNVQMKTKVFLALGIQFAVFDIGSFLLTFAIMKDEGGRQ